MLNLAQFVKFQQRTLSKYYGLYTWEFIIEIGPAPHRVMNCIFDHEPNDIEIARQWCWEMFQRETMEKMYYR